MLIGVKNEEKEYKNPTQRSAYSQKSNVKLGGITKSNSRRNLEQIRRRILLH